MKKVMFIMVLVSLSLSLYSQKWRTVKQYDLGMTYSLPESWAVDGFGSSEEWESNGSSVCNCAGTINIGNRFEDSEIYMVVYPVRIKDSVNTNKRNRVWDMVYDENGVKTTVSTKKYTFEKTVSKWTKESAGKNADNEVWKLTTSYANQYYVFFFYSKPEVMKQNEAIIAKILDSFKVVKMK